ncbi:hypothetical protein [Rhizobium sp. OAE497]|uniref:hypothetical protein n=1 Tax=Rhizobium sp. OAE497 TaxID=2663796 RepID=UPI0018F796EC
MTIVAIQKQIFSGLSEDDFPVLKIVADSRLSNGKGEGFLTDIAPKIFSIEMRSVNAAGHITHFAPYGFAFAGSTLAAALTHSTAQFLLNSLFSNENYLPPSVEDVSAVYLDVAKKHIEQLSAPFSAMIYGYDVGSNVFRAYALNSATKPSFELRKTEIDLDAAFFRIGSGSEYFDTIFAEMGGGDVDCSSVIEQMIRRKVHRSVGGFIQMAIVDRSGFHHVPVIESIDDSALSAVKFMGADVDTIFRPRGFKFGTMAMTLGVKALDNERLIHTNQ